MAGIHVGEGCAVDGERRFSEDEIEAILHRAVAKGGTAEGEQLTYEGLTLAELKDVGREVGIPAERIEEAARSLDRPGRVRRTLGLPLSVGRTVALQRAPTDAEWDGLVADLRATFGATGTVHRDGGLRGWTNGNLHAWIEPDGSGYRLRMGTSKGSARQLGAAGVGMLGMSGVLGTLTAVGADVPLAGAGALLAMGVGILVAALGGVPAWASTRLEQMDGLANRALERLDASEPDGHQ